MNADQQIEEIRQMYAASFASDSYAEFGVLPTLKEMVEALINEAGSNAGERGFAAAMKEDYQLFLPDGSEVKIRAEFEPSDRSVGIQGGYYFVVIKEHEKAVEEILGENAELREAFEQIKKAVESVKLS
jgi:hypothetical protein